MLGRHFPLPQKLGRSVDRHIHSPPNNTKNTTISDGSNSSSSANRAIRGGGWNSTATPLQSSRRNPYDPTLGLDSIGFRVASVPEPSTAVLVLMGVGAVYLWKRRKSSL